jgi:hypothetical protein
MQPYKGIYKCPFIAKHAPRRCDQNAMKAEHNNLYSMGQKAFNRLYISVFTYVKLSQTFRDPLADLSRTLLCRPHTFYIHRSLFLHAQFAELDRNRIVTFSVCEGERTRHACPIVQCSLYHTTQTGRFVIQTNRKANRRTCMCTRFTGESTAMTHSSPKC